MDESDTHGCKVDRIADKYNLGNLDERLVRRRENEDASLRDLDAYINRRITKVALRRSGHNPVEGEADTYHRHLRHADGIASEETRRELDREGVPVHELEDDFVSYQTIRKHLNECVGSDTSRDDYEPSPSEDAERMGRIKGRAEQVISRTLNRLRKHDAISIGEPHPIVSLKVRCGDCGRTHTVSQLLRERECACAESTIEADGPPPASEVEETVQDTPR